MVLSLLVYKQKYTGDHCGVEHERHEEKSL